jgi:hypothetical protein
MKTRLPRRGHRPGYVTLIAVLIVASMLTMLMLSMYRGAAMSRDVQGASELRIDTADKEDAVLRAIVNIAPNRAMRAMKSGSDVAGVRDALSWQSIFSDALMQANGRSSVDTATLAALNLSKSANGNPGDHFNPLTTTATAPTAAELANIFKAEAQDPDFATAGINRNFKTATNFGAGYPVALNYADATKSNLDHLYPIISNSKIYGALATGLVGADVTKYPLYNLIPYPNIHFGYGTPGVNFVAKRNWWAFSMNLAANDSVLNSAVRAGSQRDFVLSLYEIPSQLAISAETFANIGTHADGTSWKHATVTGGVFATRAQVDNGIHLDSVASRDGMTLANYNSIGSKALGGDPFSPGVREQYETAYNTSMPVYLSSEAGRSTFIPINAGISFFDRYSAAAEANVLAGTSWNDYTNGASQCAMHLDVVAMNPVKLQFSYMVGTNRVSTVINAADMTATTANIAAWEGASPPRPYTVKTLVSGKVCVTVRPQLFAAYLASIGASGVDVNNSISVNVNYTNTGMNNPAYQPTVPTRSTDCGVILSDCNDLTAFTKGFSIVTNLLLYISDDFNQVTTTPPAGTGLTGAFSPPTSIFAPEVRYGTDVDPAKVQIAGQMGHLGGDTGVGGKQARLLDLQLGSSTLANPDNISVNLSPIVHPAQLPPITMKYWLVVLEERKREYYR